MQTNKLFLFIITLIANKQKVTFLNSSFQEKRKRQDERKKVAEALGDRAPPKLVPKTIDSMREPDETTVEPATTSADADEKVDEKVDEEVMWDITNDEFREYFGKTYEPKVLLTSADNPHSVSIVLKLVFLFYQTLSPKI